MLAASSCPSDRDDAADAAVLPTCPLVAQAGALAGGFFVIDALGPEGVAPFIYFQF